MSKALKCDRCGKYFSPYLIGDGDLFTSIPEIKLQTRREFVDHIVLIGKKDINFCPNCTQDFICDFMEDFNNETSYLYDYGYFVDAGDPDKRRSSGRYEYEGSSSDCDSETVEREDDPK